MNAILTAAAISAAFTGVAVSPRAKNVATVLRISTKGKQPDGIGRERATGGDRVVGGEGAAQEQRAHDQVGDDDEGGEAGDRQQQREFDGAVLRVRRAGLVAGGDAGAPSPAASRCRRRCR